MGWLSLAGLGLSLFNGFQKAGQAKSIGRAGYNQAMYNANQASYFGQLNADAIHEAGAINAGMVREIGELNAWYIQRAGERNMKMYGIQADEELRRHVLAEKMSAGTIRAAQSGTGIQVNTGANLRYLNFQIDEGLNQRHFMQVRHAETLNSMQMDMEDRMYVTRQSASLQAGAIEANAAIGAEMALAESQMQYGQYMQQGQLALQQGAQGASSALWGTLGSIGMWGMSGGFSEIGNMFSFTSSSSAPALLSANTTSAPPALLSQSSINATPFTRKWFDNTASDYMGTL